MNKKINFFYLLVILVSLYNCKHKSHIDKKTAKYRYTKEILRYNLGDNRYRDDYVYISKKDTIGFQYIHYKNNVIDTSKSVFYALDLERKSTKEYAGKITYYYDSIQDGKLDILIFSLLNKIDGEKNNLEFEIKNKNSLKFNFENDSDTIVGILSAYHIKDTKDKDKVRLRNRLIPIDNYNKTNNPLIGLESEL